MSDYHDLEQDLEAQLERTSRFRRMAFHVHSPDSHDWGKEADRDRNDREQFTGHEGLDRLLDELAEHLDIVCITDHMKCGLACELSKRAAGRSDIDLAVFPGMEVSCRVPPGHSDAIHVLVVFPPLTSVDVIERIFSGQTDLCSHDERTGQEEITVDSLADWGEQIVDAGALFVFAHVDQPQRGHRAYVRRRRGESMEMIGGNLDPDAERAISHEYAEHLARLGPTAVEVKEGGEDREHYAQFATSDGRTHRVAAVARSDHHAIESFGNRRAVTHVKVSRPDFRCVRDALRFFRTRIRFDEDLPQSPSPRIVGMRIRSTGEGLFEESVIAFNENLSCLIGPRGCGKSTIVEALRYVLGKVPELERVAGGDAPESSFAQLALGTIGANLRDTQIELIYETAAAERLVVSATYDADDAVTSRAFALSGEDRQVGPQAVSSEFPVRIFSWSEIETLGRRPDLQRQLIDRLAEDDLSALLDERNSARQALDSNRQSIERIAAEMTALLEADGGALRRYQEYKTAFDVLNTPEVQQLFTGLDATRRRLQLLEEADRQLGDLASKVQALRESLQRELSTPALTGTDDELQEWFDGELGPALALTDLADSGRRALEEIEDGLGGRRDVVRQRLQELRDERENREAELREKTNAEPNESIRRDKREEARARYELASKNRQRYEGEHGRLRDALKERRDLAAALKLAEDAVTDARRNTAGDLTNKLGSLEATDSTISIAVEQSADRSVVEAHYEAFLNRERGGHYRERQLAERLGSLDPSVVVVAILDNDGSDLRGALDEDEATRLVSACYPFMRDDDAGVEVVDEALSEILELEEKRAEDLVKILSDGDPVEKLSPGGRSSAMLPLIAMADTVPLIIDQPEDNLDNRMVGRTLTSILAELKERRQIIITTHNPNIVVGGDAEQVVVLDAPRDRAATVEDTGSIDDEEIIRHVIRIMEGGKEAFEERERRYHGHLNG